MLKQKNYERTNYPKIYKNTYWGNFLRKENEEINIIENRNKFINKYGIIKINEKDPRYIEKIIDRNNFDYLDHVEIYLTNSNKYLLVSSPYTLMSEIGENAKKHMEAGWIEDDRIYNNSAKTFIMLVDKRVRKTKPI